MSFTKKQYEETARIIAQGRAQEEAAKAHADRGEFHDAYDAGYSVGFIDAYREMGARLSAMFARDNPRFDPERFAAACEPKGGA